MDFTDLRLKQLLDYWQRKRAGRKFPLRADIDPLELRFILGNLVLVDVVPGQVLRFRYRIWGSTLVEFSGVDMTGRHVDEITPAELARLAQQAYVKVTETGLPDHWQFNHIFDDRWFIHERLLLPLGTDQAPDKVGMILGGLCQTPTENPPDPAQAVRS